jgi:hypothetical protein
MKPGNCGRLNEKSGSGMVGGNDGSGGRENVHGKANRQAVPFATASAYDL